MNSNPYQTRIAPISDSAARPIWSVMIPTYHCARYLPETLESVLSQAFDPAIMQIEVIDDCSIDDDPIAVAKTIAPDRVQIYRQPQNVGHVRNFQTCLERARGSLIHLLHGDDCVRPGFYEKMQQLFDQHSEIGAAYCRHQYINDRSEPHYHEELEQPNRGILTDALAKITARCRIQTPSIVVRREVYETLGAFDRRLTYSEDWEMWTRIAVHYPIGYEPETLAFYRTHQNSNTARNQRNGQQIADLRRAIDIMSEYLPQPELAQSGREYYGAYALRQAEKLIDRREFSSAIAYMGEALRCSRSIALLRGSLQLGKKMLRTL